MSIVQILRSEEGRYTLLESYDRSNLNVQFCLLCLKELSGPAYFLDDERLFGLHKACAEKPGEIKQHPLHDLHHHTLIIEDCESYDICDGCRHFIMGFIFRCKKCKFKLDFHCIYSLDHDHEGQALIKERAEKLTFYHRHELQLFYVPSVLSKEGIILCYCCLKCINGSGYTCSRCDAILIHESCSDAIPKQFKSLLHPQHILRCFATRRSDNALCDGCKADILGIKLGCKSCKKSFHISCAMRSRPSFKVLAHHHNLFYTDYCAYYYKCNECKKSCEGSSAICRCMECNIQFHIECILPRELDHECHHHTLTLTNSFVPKYNHPTEYLCDICEKKGETGLYVYYCEECDFVAHIECLFSEENPQLNDLEQHIDIAQEIETKDDREINESEETSEGDNESIESNEEDSYEESVESSEGDGYEESNGRSTEENENETDTKQESTLQDSVRKLDKRIKHVQKKIDKHFEKIEKLTSELGRLKNERANVSSTK